MGSTSAATDAAARFSLFCGVLWEHAHREAFTGPRRSCVG